MDRTKKLKLYANKIPIDPNAEILSKTGTDLLPQNLAPPGSDTT